MTPTSGDMRIEAVLAREINRTGSLQDMVVDTLVAVLVGTPVAVLVEQRVYGRSRRASRGQRTEQDSQGRGVAREAQRLLGRSQWPARGEGAAFLIPSTSERSLGVA